MASKLDYSKTLLAIARDIEGLTKEFPQLKGFSAVEHAQPEGLRISYAYHTHRPERCAGWTAGVPNPDEDGIWFTIDFHDKDSTAQIHTQPVVPKAAYGKKVVMFLILEGPATRPVGGRIREVLEHNGVRKS